jgi:hypothetical protein
MSLRVVTCLAGCLLLAAAPVGCSSATELDNPTGACTPEGDGARPGYHYPGDSKWLPDCENPLAREYFRVFTQNGASAAIIPRPDGAADLQPVCADDAHALHALVEKYALCESASSAAQVERVNDMLPADALTITHFLHGKLRFSSGPGDEGISPPPLPSDVIDACDLAPSERSTALSEICERERNRLRSGIDIGYFYTGPGAVELVARLNELYGIE